MSVDLYAWVLLPLMIFAARVADVSLGTVRVIFVSRGLKYLAPVVGFFEVLIWLLAIGQIMQNLSSPICYVAYACGFSMGNYVGISIAEKLSLGVVMIRIVTNKDAGPLIEKLRGEEYGVTSIDGQGVSGKVKLVFTIVPRREVREIVGVIKEFNPQAFYSIEEVGFVQKAYLPLRKSWRSQGVSRAMRPFRKGK